MSYKDSIRQNKFIKFGSIIRGQIYVDKSPSIENTILLCGSGRSGTTWIAEILNNDNQSISVDKTRIGAIIKCARRTRNKCRSIPQM